MKRREIIKLSLASAGAALLAKTGAATAQSCMTALTPPQPEGPFYPRVNQLDEDADLVMVRGRPDIARGRIVIVEGRVTNQLCQPIQGALVEIWQACESGRYNHRSDPNPAPLDPNFQYWGEALTDENGFYRFRTIIPGAYPASRDWMRPPHIHFKITGLGHRELITQMYFAGERYNDEDLYIRALPPEERKKVVIEFKETAEQPHPVGQFDIQLLRLF